MPFLWTAVTSYLLGSIPFGYLLVRMFRGGDVRKTGSGNIGATNVARTSPALGAATLLLDALKGFAATAMARHLHPVAPMDFMATAALFAVVGHMFPVWLRWRGGKGVATALGAFLCVAPKSVLFMVAIFVLVVAVTRYISLGSMVAALCFPWIAAFVERPGILANMLMAATCVLILVRHRENIDRLIKGQENRFSLVRK